MHFSNINNLFPVLRKLLKQLEQLKISRVHLQATLDGDHSAVILDTIFSFFLSQQYYRVHWHCPNLTKFPNQEIDKGQNTNQQAQDTVAPAATRPTLPETMIDEPTRQNTILTQSNTLVQQQPILTTTTKVNVRPHPEWHEGAEGAPTELLQDVDCVQFPQQLEEADIEGYVKKVRNSSRQKELLLPQLLLKLATYTLKNIGINLNYRAQWTNSDTKHPTRFHYMSVSRQRN